MGNMKFDEFKDAVVSKIREYLPETFANADVRLNVVTKNNDLQLTGLIINAGATERQITASFGLPGAPVAAACPCPAVAWSGWQTSCDCMWEQVSGKCLFCGRILPDFGPG